MALDVLIVPDKFKSTLTAQAAATLIGQGWTQVRPQDRVTLLPMSDGGDGFGEVLAELLPVQPRLCGTIDAAHRPCEATWWWDTIARTAIIESARVIGLVLLPPKLYHPFQLDTFGLGRVLRAVEAAGGLSVLVGIGGSATNDGGFGLARALGWTFIGSNGTSLTRWTELEGLTHVLPPSAEMKLPEILVAVDVQNPLLGPLGASRVYGPQKGLRPADFALAEASLGRLAEVVRQDLGLNTADEPGAGAAGGLGFGLRCFQNARLESGFDLFGRYARLDERIGSSDLVITGEGSIDPSTVMGKGVGEIANLCRRRRIPCLGLAGILPPMLVMDVKDSGFTQLYGMAPQLTSPEAAMASPHIWLPRLAANAAREWS